MGTTETSDTTGTNPVTFTIRLPEALVIRMDVLAAQERKSRQRWIEEALGLVADRQEQLNAQT